jgi:hypothetical protein
VLAVLACIVILAVIGLGFYALHKIKPGWFRIQAGAGQRFTFSIEMGQGGGDRPPREERRELEAGHDQPRELEAGREPGSSEPPGAAGQADERGISALPAVLYAPVDNQGGSDGHEEVPDDGLDLRR